MTAHQRHIIKKSQPPLHDASLAPPCSSAAAVTPPSLHHSDAVLQPTRRSHSRSVARTPIPCSQAMLTHTCPDDSHDHACFTHSLARAKCARYGRDRSSTQGTSTHAHTHRRFSARTMARTLERHTQALRSALAGVLTCACACKHANRLTQAQEHTLNTGNKIIFLPCLAYQGKQYILELVVTMTFLYEKMK